MDIGSKVIALYNQGPYISHVLLQIDDGFVMNLEALTAQNNVFKMFSACNVKSLSV